MKKIVKTLLMLLLLFPLHGVSQKTNRNVEKIVLGIKKTIHSTILNEDREIWIYAPNSNATNNSKLPVMYILDGPSFFNSFSSIAEYLNKAGKMPEMIIVGIANTNRLRDLTPSHSVFWSDGEQDSAALGASGGGENFIKFISDELIPYIDSSYKPAPYKMLVGHSLGGLTVINILLNHKELFDSYVAIDPSIWWDKHLVMKQTSEKLKSYNYSGKRLYFASANTMAKDMDTIRVLHDQANINSHVKENLQYRDILKSAAKSNLVWDWKYYPNDNHVSIPVIASYDAFRTIFKDYEFEKDLNDKSITLNQVKDHYAKVSKMMNYQVLPSQNMINNIGYNFLSNKEYDKAYSFFNLNIENYPSSANVYDSMGDLYIEKKDDKKAIELFKKALSLKEQPETRKKLEKLEMGK
ncbi:hypothetical protein FCR2A7T_24290 [Flavobacterium cauense R2A-7]|uniref:Alpha/beta superfamily hydrolase n=1 Tax=Flavobacterium cauense R2A-7 TaxID=1341154 RepID=V6S3Q3_9FLAO|nr:alpha/beta hydrolase-fold protein [Flavobacterium cauense]ESU19015.1 hypothetical protein FCR2A7T_24290 [Flavobacterium cauense R2A-7]KGO82353.1 hypothetical protein Q762_06665 [Flavobacterium cauense R2A-7]TWI15320.1 hypothetical protein IP98_00312 [Flavobacterium cauense R2A-7]